MRDNAMLISGRQAARLVGVDRKTWKSIAEANGLMTVSTGSGRGFYQRLEVERLIGIRENA